MKFTLSTKPFSDALNLGVIPGNITKYFKVSCLIQLTASKHELRMNLEASGICTEILLKGQGDADAESTTFVDCLTLKQIVGTFDSSTTTIEFVEGGIILHSGSSKCTLPELANAEDGELRRPALPSEGATKLKMDLSNWKFIKDYQMYAVALSFAKPIYTKIWVGEAGDVIVGDFDNSLFTFSKKNKLGKTCLLTDTMINLFTSLPEGADITLMDDTFRVDVQTDGFDYAAELTPSYENTGSTGDYHAADFMATVTKTTDNAFTVPIPLLSKFLSQADILSSGSNDSVNLTLTDSILEVKNENVDVKFKVEGNCNNFSIPLDLDQFKSIVSHVDEEKMQVCPVIQEGEISGLVIWTDNLTVVVGAKDEGSTEE